MSESEAPLKSPIEAVNRLREVGYLGQLHGLDPDYCIYCGEFFEAWPYLCKKHQTYIQWGDGWRPAVWINTLIKKLLR